MGQPAVAINSVQGSLKVIDKKIKEVLAEKLANKKHVGSYHNASKSCASASLT